MYTLRNNMANAFVMRADALVYLGIQKHKLHDQTI